MKYYLLALLFIIMAAGARTMFQIAYNGAVKEHTFGPDKDTTFLIWLAVWFIVMMLFDVALLNFKQLPKRNLLVAFLTVGVVAPVIYMAVTR